MKSIKCLVVLVCMTFISVNLFGQEKTLQTERDGFQWYKLKQNGKVGAQSTKGTTFIPLSRGYRFICYHDTHGGWYSVEKDGKSGYGACDITGREIVAPGKYDNVSYRNVDGYEFCFVELNEKEGACDMNGREIISPRYKSLIFSSDGYVFKYQDASGNWISTGITVPKGSNTNYASTTTTTTSSGGSGQTFEFYFPAYYDFVNKKNIYKDGACTFYTIRFELQPSQIAVKVIECDADIEADKKENVIESYSITPSKSHLEIFTNSHFNIVFLVSGKDRGIQFKWDTERINIIYDINDKENSHSFKQNEDVNKIHSGMGRIICPDIKVENNFQSKGEKLLKELRKYSWKKVVQK